MSVIYPGTQVEHVGRRGRALGRKTSTPQLPRAWRGDACFIYKYRARRAAPVSQVARAPPWSGYGCPDISNSAVTTSVLQAR
eukprot:scaffold55605_cov91-Phaeocystis_antarctica.AAC.3